MDAKAYLQQVMNIDQQINSRLEQLGRLKTLATHTTSTISDMPKAQGSVSRMEDTVIKIITMEHEIDDEIDGEMDSAGFDDMNYSGTYTVDGNTIRFEDSDDAVATISGDTITLDVSDIDGLNEYTDALVFVKN